MPHVVYQGEEYLMYIDYLDYVQKEKYYLYSEYERDGLEKVVDEDGDVFYQKEVSEDDLDFAYELWYRAEYFGHEFDVVSSVEKKLFERDVIVLETEVYDDIAKLLDFKVYDRLSRIKELSFSDIDRLIEVRVPILKFKGMEKVETEIPKDKVAEYINNKLE